MRKNIKEFKTQKETTEFANKFCKQFEKEPTKIELTLGAISYFIIYGGGIVFGIYMIYQALKT